MDPLSVSASVAGLTTIVEMIVDRLYKYMRDFKNAEAEVSSLAQELMSLFGVLNQLKLVARRFESEPEFDPALQSHHIVACQKTLDLIQITLQAHNITGAKRSVDRLKSKAKWPFSRSKTKDLITDVERHKSTLSLALNADCAHALLCSLSRQGDIENGIGKLNTKLDRVAKTAERQKMLDSLGTLDPAKTRKASLQLRQPGTGQWFLEGEEFQRWVQADRARLWMNGIPGSGKTILTSTIIEEVEKSLSKERALAYMFCNYKEPNSLDVNHIMGALARQFAVQNEESFEILEEFHKRHHPEGKPFTTWTEQDLIQLIQKMTSVYDHAFIIVDAVDEIGQDRSSVIGLLQNLNDQSTDNVKILFTSRNEPDIQSMFKDYDQVCVAAQSSDLRLYVAAEIEERTRTRKLKIRDAFLKEDIMQRLVDEADGMFRWVACQIDTLCALSNDRARRKALETMPVGLDETYERILRNVSKSPLETQQMVQRTLKLVVLARGEMSMAGLAQILSVETGDEELDEDAVVDEDAILFWCSSLIRRNESGCVVLAHFTCKTFLTSIDSVKNPELAPYKVIEDEDNALIAQLCLTYVCLKVFDEKHFQSQEEVEQIWREFPFRRYAVTFWPMHINGDEDESLLKLLKKIFEPSKPTKFLNWMNEHMINTDDTGIYGFSDYLNFSVEVTTLHWAAILALPRLCTWLVSLKDNINSCCKLFSTPLNCAIGGKSGYEFSASAEPSWRSKYRHETIRVLLENNADTAFKCIDLKGGLFWDPTTLAIRSEDVESMRILLKAGAELTKTTLEFCLAQMQKARVWEWIDEVEKINLRVENEDLFQRLAIRCDAEHTADAKSGVAKMLAITRMQGDASLSMEHKAHLLRDAARYGQSVVLEKLLIVMKDHDAPDPTKSTALQLAASSGHQEIVKRLVEHGANVDRTSLEETRTPLQLAIKANHPEIVKLLLEAKANPLIEDKKGYQATHIAAMLKSPQMIQILRSFHPELRLNHISKKFGNTPLLVAALYGSVDVCKYILKEFNDSTNLADRSFFGDSCLHLAVISGSLEKVRFFLDQDMDVLEKGEDGRTLLAYVPKIKTCWAEIIDLLIAKGAPPNAPDDYGQTPLMELVTQNEQNADVAAAFKRLLKEDVGLNFKDCNGDTVLHRLVDAVSQTWSPIKEKFFMELLAKGAQLDIKNDEGFSPWERLQILFSADEDQFPCMPSFIPILDEHSHENPDLQNMGLSLAAIIKHVIEEPGFEKTKLSHKYRGRTLLSSCIIRNAIELIDKILEMRPELVDVRDSSSPNWSPFEWACALDPEKKVADKVLACSKKLSTADFSGRLPINNALSGGSIRFAEALLEHNVDPNCEDEQGLTALMVALQHGHIDTVRVLLEKGAFLHARSHRGLTASHFAMWVSNLESLKLLKEEHVNWEAKCRWKIFYRVEEEVCPLHVAATFGKHHVIQYLMDEKCLSSIDVVTSSNLTGLWIAAANGFTSVLKVLLDGHADTGIQDIQSGSTALHMAASLGHKDSVRLLLDYEADPRVKDRDGFTPAVRASLSGYSSLADELQEAANKKVISIDEIDEHRGIEGNTAVHRTARDGDVTTLKIILDAGADINARNKNGTTPAMLAASQGHLKVLDLLLEYGADMDAVDDDGWNTLNHACRNSKILCIPDLLALGQSWSHRDRYGVTVMGDAVSRNDGAIDDFLIHHAGDFIPVTTHPIGGNILTMASYNGTNVFLEWVLERLSDEQKKLLLNAPAELYSTPIITAILNDEYEKVEKLVDAGSDLEIDGGMYGTPLIAACILGRLNIAKLLHSRGASLKTTAVVDNKTISVEEAAAKHRRTKEWYTSIKKIEFDGTL